MFKFFKKRYSKKNKEKANSAFTLAELLVASAISAIVLSIAYSLVNLILTSNKSDNTNIGLSTKIENALDFVVVAPCLCCISYWLFQRKMIKVSCIAILTNDCVLNV